MSPNVSFYCVSTCALRVYIFYLKVEFALIKSLIIPIDSMISFVDLRVRLPPPLTFLSFSNFSYVFYKAFFLDSVLPFTVIVFYLTSATGLLTSPVGSSAEKEASNLLVN